MVKNLPAMQETPGLGRSPGDRNDSSLLAWEIPWTEEPGRLHSWGHKSQTRFSDYTTTTNGNQDQEISLILMKALNQEPEISHQFSIFLPPLI